jgi:hypothetical protein
MAGFFFEFIKSDLSGSRNREYNRRARWRVLRSGGQSPATDSITHLKIN